MSREHKYPYLMVSLLAGVVLITATSPQSSTAILCVSSGVFTLMIVNAYILAERRSQMRSAAVLGTLAAFPFTWINIHGQALDPGLAKAIYGVNLIFFVLFTVYCGQIVFRSIMRAHPICNHDIFGAIYLYLLLGILFAQLY